MLDKVNTLLEAIKPVRFVKDVGITVHSQKGYYFIKEPGSTSNCLILKDKELVSLDTNNDFSAGNIVTFLSYYKNISVKEALDKIVSSYFNKLSQPIYDSINWATASMASHITSADLLHKTIQRNKKLLTTDSRYSKCKLHVRKYCEHESYVKNIVSPFTGLELNNLLEQISQDFTTLKRKFRENHQYVVFPIHVNYSTICGLYVESVNTGSSCMLQVIPYAKGFFGLYNLRPNEFCTHILPDMYSVLEQTPTYYNHGSKCSQSCVSLQTVDEDSQLGPDIIRNGLMLITSATQTKDIVANQSCFYELGLLNKNQLFHVSFDAATESRTYLIKKFMLDMEDGLATQEKLIKYFQSFDDDPIVIERIRKYLKYANKKELLRMFESGLNKNEVLRVNGLTITSTKDGYIASSDRNVPDVLFTNFTFKITDTILFKDESDTYYSGYINSNDSKIPYILAKREITQAPAILQAANTAIATCKDPSKHKPPTLIDTTFSSVLRNIVADQISKSRISMGVSYVGWSSSYDTFVAPDWSANGTSIIRNSHFKHPRVNILNNFNFDQKVVSDTDVTFNQPNINLFIAVIISMLGRSYHNVKCSPVRVISNKQNRLLLVSLLSLFRQKKSININPNLRISRKEDKMLPGVNGCPLVCSCSNQHIVDKLYDPVFVLSSTGIDLPALDVDHTLLSNFMESLLSNFINDLIQTDGNIFSCDYDSRSLDSMILEGLSILKVMYPQENWVVATEKHQGLQNLLCQQHPDFLQDIVELDFENQKIRINPRYVDGELDFDKIFSESELTVTKRHGYYFCDAAPFLEILRAIFVEDPKIGSYKAKKKLTNNKKVNEGDDVKVG